MAILRNIEWTDDSRDTIVHKVDLSRDQINRGSKLTVRDSQAAIFAHKGKMADVFLPGFYTLDTDNVPILTTLMSWKYGFQNPFRSDLYFVNTRQFTGQKWGTQHPIIIRDKDYGVVRVRGFGNYAFRVTDPYVFMQEISGTASSFETSDIKDYLKSIVVAGITDAIGECKIPILDMAANLLELGEVVRKSLQPTFEKLGMEITKFVFESFSLPEELEKALDKNATLGMYRNNMDTYMQMAQADAMRDAAKNPGMAGTAMGAGMGIGLGNMFGNMMTNQTAGAQAQATPTEKCAKCGATVKQGAKFCSECGAPMGNVCPSCGATVRQGAKFCSECGHKFTATCPSCGATVKSGAKFCPECGEKL